MKILKGIDTFLLVLAMSIAGPGISLLSFLTAPPSVHIASPNRLFAEQSLSLRDVMFLSGAPPNKPFIGAIFPDFSATPLAVIESTPAGRRFAKLWSRYQAVEDPFSEEAGRLWQQMEKILLRRVAKHEEPYFYGFYVGLRNLLESHQLVPSEYTLENFSGIVLTLLEESIETLPQDFSRAHGSFFFDNGESLDFYEAAKLDSEMLAWARGRVEAKYRLYCDAIAEGCYLGWLNAEPGAHRVETAMRWAYTAYALAHGADGVDEFRLGNLLAMQHRPKMDRKKSASGPQSLMTAPQSIPLPRENTDPDWQSAGWLNEAPQLTGLAAFAYAAKRAAEEGLRRLSDPETESIAKAALNLAAYVHGQEFDRLMFSSRSGYFPFMLVAAAWQRLYPEEKFPEFFYFGDEANNVLYKRKYKSTRWAARLRKALLTEMGVMAFAGERLCFVDDVVGTGFKYGQIRKTFEKAGLSKISYAVLGVSEVAAAGRLNPADPRLFAAVAGEGIFGEIHRLGIALSHGNRGVNSEIERIVTELIDPAGRSAGENPGEAFRHLRQQFN